jgi:serine/threonine-protein kinase
MYGVGQILAGKYRVDYQLGEGGMGVVLACTHMHLGTPIALKLLRPEMAQGSVVERFLREARASAQLRSENVCRVSDVGVLDNGVPFIVMEMLVGQDLQSMLRTNGPMPVAIASDYILQACIGIAEAHAAKIVHRDLKPGNLMWTQRPDGTHLIKVLDFGVAKAPDGVNFSLTQTSNIIGSPGYMSPEQLKSSKDVDVRSDIWSLGILLYELVSGKPPWNGESITELALRVAMDPMPPLVGMGPFETVIKRCLEKEPARRFGNIADLAAALAPFAGPRGPELAAAVARVLRGSQVSIGQPNVTMQSTPTTLRGASGVVVSSTRQTTHRSWKLPAVIGIGAAGGIIAVVLATTGGNVDSGSHVRAPAAAPEAPVVPDKTPDTAKAPDKVPDTAPTPDKASDKTVKPTEAPKADSMTVSVPKPDTDKPDTEKPDTTKKSDTKPHKKSDAKKHTTPTPPTTTPTTPTKSPEDVGDSRT